MLGIYVSADMRFNTLHQLWGHPSEATMRNAAKEMNVTFTGIFELCEARALGKAKKANVSDTK